MKRSNIDAVKEISMRKFILSSIPNLSFKGVDHSGRGWGEEIADGEAVV
jgi:hypothetical protein